MLLLWVHGAFLVDIRKTCCHIKQLVKWLDSALKGLARWVISPPHHFVTQTKTNLWAMPHLMKYRKPTIWISIHIPQLNVILDKRLYFDAKCVSLSKSPKVALNLLKNTSKSLSKGDWCSNKGVNQAKVMPDNKVLMSPTWTRPVRYQWRWSRMTKHVWLTKPWNFERVLSNLLGS